MPMDWNLYLLANVGMPTLMVAIGIAAYYIHGRYMDRVDAQEAAEAAAKRPAE